MIAFRIILVALGAAYSLVDGADAQLDRLLTPVASEILPALPSSRHNPAASPVAKTYLLGADAFVAELEKELGKRLALDGELKLTLAQPWKPMSLPAETFAVIISETPKTGIAGTFAIRAQITCEGETIGDLSLSLRAQHWREVWTATNRLERGQALDRLLLTTSKVDVLNERQPSLLADVDPTTFEITQTVTAGRPLTRRDIAERPLVRKGQVVEVVAQQGQLAISMKALALENGAGGDLIKLRNIESHKEFTAQILNDNKVQVHF